VFGGAPVSGAIPAFHGLNGDAIPNFDFSAYQWFSQWRFGAIGHFAVAGNIQL
jgi:hypothetical protein